MRRWSYELYSLMRWELFRWFIVHCHDDECPFYFTKPSFMTLRQWHDEIHRGFEEERSHA